MLCLKVLNSKPKPPPKADLADCRNLKKLIADQPLISSYNTNTLSSIVKQVLQQRKSSIACVDLLRHSCY